MKSVELIRWGVVRRVHNYHGCTVLLLVMRW